MKKIKITRQELERLGITEITPSGKIYMGKVEKRPFKIWAKHKWGNDKYYWGISIYDPLLHEEQVKKGCKTRNGVRIFLLHRVIWAWFYGETPDNMDVCHVDDDPDNNCIYFLEVKTHQQNLYERKGNRSKFTTEKWKAEHNEGNK